jgi:hydroxymethylbilane synthase
LSRGKKFVIASKTDTLSVIRLNGVLGSLRNIHPRSEFIDFRDLKIDGGDRHAKIESRWGLADLVNMLVKKDVDIVVADAREIPLRLQSKVSIAAVPERSNPYDVFISQEELILDDQPEEAHLAASDSVKVGQLLYYRPDLVVVEDGGGFESLFTKMEEGEINGFVMAASDVEAINMQDKVVEVFTSSICTPVAGQGSMGLITRVDDGAAHAILKEFGDPSSSAELELERMFVEHVSKSGKGLVGVLANVEGDDFELEAAITAADGSEKVSAMTRGKMEYESKTIEKLVSELYFAGGERILRNFKRN